MLGIDVWFILRPECVHESVDDNEKEGHDEVEDEPDVDHLDIGGVGQVGVDLAAMLSLRKFRSIDFTWTKRATSTSIAVRLIAMIDSK